MGLTKLGSLIKEDILKVGVLEEYYNPHMGNVAIPVEDFNSNKDIFNGVMSLINLGVIEYDGVKYVWTLSREEDDYIVEAVDYFSTFC